MARLRNTSIYRSGETVSRWHYETETVEIRKQSNAKDMRIEFQLASKGGGRTDCSVRIEANDFPTIVRMMTLVDKQAMLEALSEELRRIIFEASKS